MLVNNLLCLFGCTKEITALFVWGIFNGYCFRDPLVMLFKLCCDRKQIGTPLPLFCSRYAFTILSNVGVYVAMFLLLFFVTDSTNTKLTSMNVWIYHQEPELYLSSHSNSSGYQENEIGPQDVWIFSVNVFFLFFCYTCNY